MRAWGLWSVAALLLSAAALVLAQKPFHQYPGWEHYTFPLPPDWEKPGEWVFARLMYPPASSRSGYRRRRSFADWSQGFSAWTTDYPASDRHLIQAVRRLTRVDARSVEQAINLDDTGEVFYWPWLYAVEVGQWELSPDQAKQLREYLLRGGFLMVDDFHGTSEWDIFTASMSRVFPDRSIEDLDSKAAIFRSLYEIDQHYQVPGEQYLDSGRTYEKDGVEPRWRGIYDDHGRLMVAICHNMDLGDSWEHADNPDYPEKFSALGLRIGINYIVYALTH